jgi:HSP20 family protein
MRKHPIEDLLDSWMDMIDVMNRGPRMWTQPEGRPSIGDWEDRNGDIVFTVDMPGVQKKDIELMVDKHMVKVTAKTEDRDYSFSQEFQMELNPSKVKANFNNGVLDITIEKAEESQGKKIAIK